MKIAAPLQIDNKSIFSYNGHWVVSSKTKFIYYSDLEELVKEHEGISKHLLDVYMKVPMPSEEFIKEVEWIMQILK